MRHSLAVFLLLTLVACSSDSPPDANDPANKLSAEEMYKDAKDSLNNENYETAIKKFESLQSRYPYGRYAQQALLELAYAYYRQNEPESAVSAAERFIKQHPNSPNVDYAYYVKGLANFKGERGLLDSLGRQDPSERDPRAAQESFAAFKDLVTRFPASRYAPDARVRMRYLINALAKYEIHVASYYMRRGAHISAVNRAKEVLTQYPHSPATRDALLILVQGYDAMGMKKLRDDAQRVLDRNFPQNTADATNTNNGISR
ncbi:MAG: outer membrane protein assembly factor BamD [Gallionellales bacterium RIFCSPLOWO2_02_FULL_57_47]|nr:MAG: outer membrane protein assembly factor BamD [Gallionellales bacterium RIFCSPLOWO2_02_FULL_57_47]OGT18185.1 MAG: outer membrane protein assembly factor BamD [Gallionellales bacterium RIFCSPHIGHO2_02_FULL_57_16]